MNNILPTIVTKCYQSNIDIDDFIWFTFEANEKVRGELSGKDFSALEINNFNLPFKKTAIAGYGIHEDGNIECQSGRFWIDEDDCLQIATHIVNNKTGKFFDVIVSPEFHDGENQFSVSCEEEISKEELERFCSIALGLFTEFHFWLEHADKKSTDHAQAHKLTGTGRRQLAAGKTPLITWKTVIVESSSPKQPHQGGTHASPKLHSRRGHHRTLKTGSRIWIKSCTVGKAINGIGFHDYVLKTI